MKIQIFTVSDTHMMQMHVKNKVTTKKFKISFFIYIIKVYNQGLGFIYNHWVNIWFELDNSIHWNWPFFPQKMHYFIVIQTNLKFLKICGKNWFSHECNQTWKFRKKMNYRLWRWINNAYKYKRKVLMIQTTGTYAQGLA